jgi:hypothetical protein
LTSGQVPRRLPSDFSAIVNRGASRRQDNSLKACLVLSSAPAGARLQACRHARTPTHFPRSLACFMPDRSVAANPTSPRGGCIGLVILSCFTGNGWLGDHSWEELTCLVKYGKIYRLGIPDLEGDCLVGPQPETIISNWRAANGGRRRSAGICEGVSPIRLPTRFD